MKVSKLTRKKVQKRNHKYEETRCAAYVFGADRQCKKSAGYGPEGLLCRQHAGMERVEIWRGK